MAVDVQTQITLPVTAEEFTFLRELMKRENATSLPNLLRDALINVADESGVVVPPGVLAPRRKYRPSRSLAWRSRRARLEEVEIGLD